MKLKNSVSIVIPTLNRPEKIIKAITSVDNQTFDGVINCIIVDSSENDLTKKVIENYIPKNKNVNLKYLKNKNSIEPIDNWILGVKYVHSTFSKFLCDDDWLSEDYLEKSIDNLYKHKVDCVVTNINLVNEKNDFIENYYKFSKGIASKNRIVNSILGLDTILPVSPTANIMRTEIFIKSFNDSLIQIECTKKLFGFDFYMSYYPVFHGNGTFLDNEGLVYSLAGLDSMTLNVKKAKIYYCFLNSIIKFIDNSKYEITEIQTKTINEKLGSLKLKSILNREYKALIYNNNFQPKIKLFNILKGQIKKFYIKIIYRINPIT